MSINLDTHKTAVAVLQDTITTIQQTHNNERVETEKTAESLKVEAEELRKHNDELTSEVSNLKKALETTLALNKQLAATSSKDKDTFEIEKTIFTNAATALKADIKAREEQRKEMLEKIMTCSPETLYALGIITETEKNQRIAEYRRALIETKSRQGR